MNTLISSRLFPALNHLSTFLILFSLLMCPLFAHGSHFHHAATMRMDGSRDKNEKQATLIPLAHFSHKNQKWMPSWESDLRLTPRDRGCGSRRILSIHCRQLVYSSRIYHASLAQTFPPLEEYSIPLIPPQKRS